MSLFDGGDYTGLFKNPESAFARINHSMDDEEKRRKAVGTIATLEDLAKEKTKKSKKKSKKASEKKKEIEKTKLDKEKENLRSTASNIIEQLKNVDVATSELSNIDSIDAIDCKTKLSTVNTWLNEIEQFTNLVSKSDSEVRTYIDEKINILKKYKQTLTQNKTTLETRLSDIAKSNTREDVEKAIDSHNSIIYNIKETIGTDASNLRKLNH
jgi:hypothetical protein